MSKPLEEPLKPEQAAAFLGMGISTLYKTIKRGEIVTSMMKLSGRWKWSRNKLRHFLGLLEKDGMIERKSNHNYTHLSVCNYDPYQDSRTTEGTTEGQLKDNRRTTEGGQLKKV